MGYHINVAHIRNEAVMRNENQ